MAFALSDGARHCAERSLVSAQLSSRRPCSGAAIALFASGRAPRLLEALRLGPSAYGLPAENTVHHLPRLAFPQGTIELEEQVK